MARTPCPAECRRTPESPPEHRCRRPTSTPHGRSAERWQPVPRRRPRTRGYPPSATLSIRLILETSPQPRHRCLTLAAAQVLVEFPARQARLAGLQPAILQQRLHDRMSPTEALPRILRRGAPADLRRQRLRVQPLGKRVCPLLLLPSGPTGAEQPDQHLP